MVKQILTLTLVFFSIFLINLIITYFLSKRNKFELKNNLIPFLAVSVFLGIIFALIDKVSTHFNCNSIFIVTLAAIMSSYWSFIHPLRYLFNKWSYSRDVELENEINEKKDNYKIFFTNHTDNIHTVGIIPFCKVIVLGEILKNKLTKSQLKSVVFREIRYYKKRYVFKLFFFYMVMHTFVLSMFLYINYMHYSHDFMEPLLGALVGGIFGFLWVLIGRISFYFEYATDKYSAVNYSKEVMIESLIKLDEISGGILTKGNFNHPKLEKRLSNLRTWK